MNAFDIVFVSSLRTKYLTTKRHAILGHQGDMPYWDNKGTRHTGTPKGQAILGHQGDKPYWDTKGTRHTGTPRGHVILGHQRDTPNSVRIKRVIRENVTD